MGCDIHMYIEYRQGNGMPWLADDHHEPKAKEYCSNCEHCLKGQYLECEDAYVHYNQVVATGRNYWLFGLLANVRGDGPRNPLGLPNDVSSVIKAASDRYGSDGHSHSYIYLEDFKKVLFEEYQVLVDNFNNKKDDYVEEGFVPTDRDDAFYNIDYSSKDWFKLLPPQYTTVINYCENLKKEKSLDKILLQDDNTTSEVQVRLVFWFDN